MPRPLTDLGKELERHRTALGLTKTAVAKRLNGYRPQWDRIITTTRPTVAAVEQAAAAVKYPRDKALRLAGFDPALIDADKADTDATRQQPEQQQQAHLLAG